MKKTLKIIGIIVVIALICVVGVVVSFQLSMKPDKEKAEKIKQDAEAYAKTHLNENVVVYDTLYDNMGNFNFEYAAKAKDTKEGINFLIYRDSGTNKLVDTYVATKWTNEAESALQPHIQNIFGKKASVSVYYDDEIGKELNLTEKNAGTFRDHDAKATIRLTLPRKKEETDDQLFKETVSYLKNGLGFSKGEFIVEFINEKGEWLEDNEWNQTF